MLRRLAFEARRRPRALKKRVLRSRLGRAVRRRAGERRLRRAKGPIVDLVFSVKSVRPKQIRSEVEGLYELVRERRPRAVLEIGTSKGGTTALLADAAAEDAVVVSVDLEHRPKTRERLERLVRRRLVLVTGSSHDPETLAAVREALAGRPVDVLFIDGDHSYEAARRDYELYAPLVAAGGLVAFHDIVPGEAAGGVPDLWRELRDDAAIELVDDWSQEAFGIGVLRVPS